MNDKQSIAYQSPCFLVEETMAPQFKTLYDLKKGLYGSTILTLNIGME